MSIDEQAADSLGEALGGQRQPSSLSCVSLYSGAGGLDLGFAWAGFGHVWANDVDPVALATHRAALPCCPTVVGDLACLEGSPGRGDAEVVIGGPPCQGFSVAGRMDPADPRSANVSVFLDVVDQVRPEAYVMENVAALATNPRWSDVLAGLAGRAEAVGYGTVVHLLDAADFGVAQHRRRMFIVGLRRGRGYRHVAPVPTTAGAPRTVRDALAGLPAFGAPGNASTCPARIVAARNPILRPSPWAGNLIFNGAGRMLHPDRPAPTLPASMGGNATPIVDQETIDTGAEAWIVG